MQWKRDFIQTNNKNYNYYLGTNLIRNVPPYNIGNNVKKIIKPKENIREDMYKWAKITMLLDRKTQ